MEFPINDKSMAYMQLLAIYCKCSFIRKFIEISLGSLLVGLEVPNVQAQHRLTRALVIIITSSRFCFYRVSMFICIKDILLIYTTWVNNFICKSVFCVSLFNDFFNIRCLDVSNNNVSRIMYADLYFNVSKKIENFTLTIC